MAVRPTLGLELCAGAGALGVGVAWAFPDYRTVCTVEIEPYAASVLVARQESGDLPEAPVWDDIRTFDGRPWRGVVDTVVAGFPCQDISNAGRGVGIHGERSGLWFDVLRTIRDVEPRFVVVENVAALVVRGLDTVLAGLAESGYDAEWGCLSAAAIGATNGRDRLWLLAWRQDVADAPVGGFVAQLRDADARRGQSHAARNGTPLVGVGLADAPGIGRLVSGEDDHARAGRRDGAGDADGRRQAVGYAVSGQLQRLGEPGVLACTGRAPEDEGNQRERGRHPAGDPGEGSGRAALGDAERVRSTAGLSATPRRNGVATESAESDDAGRGLPIWPPLPDDADGWRAVLERRPDLAPAQPAIRRVAAFRGTDDRLDVCLCPRTKRIAAVGNSVCPDQAAVALRSLWARAFGG